MRFWRGWFTSKPAVSCLAVTRNRVDLLRRAVECFRQQTIEGAELIIVHDHDDLPTARYAKENESRSVRVVKAPPGLKLGALRNLAVASARSEFIAQWDDDDWHAPDRLRLQLKRLKRKGKDACVLCRWTMYDDSTGRAFISIKRQWEGSIVARSSALDAYDNSLARAEDGPVVRALNRRGQVALLNRPDLYIYVFHGRNTYEREHFERIFSRSTQLGPEETEVIKAKLSGAAQTTPLPAPADLRARS